ncbi:MAG: SCO family protein [Actinomycetota bacterium]|nr:SCO family protein [Actinomycetota bacterium]
MPGMGSSSLDFGALASNLYKGLFIALGAALAIFLLYLLLDRFFDLSSAFMSDKLNSWANRGDDLSVSPRIRFLRRSFGILWLIDGLFQLRPAMPGGFVANVAQPATTGLPGPLASFVDSILRIWNAQPTKVDLITAFLQISIGIGYLTLKRGGPRRILGYSTVVWSVAVLIGGNGFGIGYAGASYLTGAPSAVVIYGFVAVVILRAERGKKDVLGDRLYEVFISVFLLVGAILQALPYEGYWATHGISSMTGAMATANQPHLISSVITSFTNFANSSPIAANAVLVALPIIGAFAIFLRPIRRVSVAIVGVVALFAWWVGQDFGIFSPTATDFNSGLPLILVTLSFLVAPVKAGADEKVVAMEINPIVRYSAFAVGSIATVISSLVAVLALVGPASGEMAIVDSSGITAVTKAAPSFNLTSYNGKSVSLASLKGRPVILTFLDPVCYDTCPLMAQEIKQAVLQLGAKGKNVAMVAVAANPIFHSVADVANFTKSEGLASMPNWYYLTGSENSLASVWKKYGIEVRTTQIGMVVHTQVEYFIDKSGVERGLIVNTGSPEFSSSYVNLIKGELARLS